MGVREYLVRVIEGDGVLSYPVQGEHSDAVAVADEAFRTYPEGTVFITVECDECGVQHGAYVPCTCS